MPTTGRSGKICPFATGMVPRAECIYMRNATLLEKQQNELMQPLYRVIYDEQCEICQAGVSWLKVLDHNARVVCHPIDADVLAAIHPDLTVDACLQELHVVTPERKIIRGADAVAELARLFPQTRLLGAAAGLPGLREVARELYRLVAHNRYALSKCRGGTCRVSRPANVRRRSRFGAFWSCYVTAVLLRLPISVAAAARDGWIRVTRYFRTFRKRFDLLDGRLRLLFLGGVPSDVVPLIFGEQFWTVVYDGVIVDPGSPKMRRSLRRHLRRLGGNEIQAIVATHHHEEHVGNLSWLAQMTGVPIHLPPMTADILTKGFGLPWARRFIIGAPPRLEPPFKILQHRLATSNGFVDVYPAAGHCNDHVVLYDPKEKLLIVGDAFMGIYFSAPNPDVDSRSWIQTLETLLELDIEILIEGHGFIHTQRKDIPDIEGVVIRRNPKEELKEKLQYLKWLREQIEDGMREGLSICAIQATCFPWGRREAWETFVNDELMRCFSLGHWSRSELVRSFVRNPGSGEILPLVYEARINHEATERR
jgi:glyoxylase-like metal-dependent hydrolase (beta-lactamase superfamily II)/predicted DCC family thiol-disulfide oxidoreductase YuxK